MAGGKEHIPLSIHMSSFVMKTLMRFAFGDYFKDEKSLLAFRKDYDQVGAGKCMFLYAHDTPSWTIFNNLIKC